MLDLTSPLKYTQAMDFPCTNNTKVCTRHNFRVNVLINILFCKAFTFEKVLTFFWDNLYITVIITLLLLQF